MFQITTINSSASRSTADEAQYEIHVRIGSESFVFTAEVRPGPNGPQVDWSDEFQDLMISQKADFAAVNLLVFQVHCGDSVVLPALVGSAA